MFHTYLYRLLFFSIFQFIVFFKKIINYGEGLRWSHNSKLQTKSTKLCNHEGLQWKNEQVCSWTVGNDLLRIDLFVRCCSFQSSEVEEAVSTVHVRYKQEAVVCFCSCKIMGHPVWTSISYVCRYVITPQGSWHSVLPREERETMIRTVDDSLSSVSILVAATV